MIKTAAVTLVGAFLTWAATGADSLSGEMDTVLKDTMLNDTIPEHTTPSVSVRNDTTRYNPLAAVGLSAMLPGAGQVYCEEYVKGGLFFATQIIMGLVTYNRYDYYTQIPRDSLSRLRSLMESLAGPRNAVKDSLSFYRDLVEKPRLPGDTLLARDSSSLLFFDSLMRRTDSTYVHVRGDYQLARYEWRLRRAVMYHSGVWMGGCYLFSLLDALNSSRYFYDTQPRNPVTAGLLSAIPGLGLGQLYNGSLSKEGFIFMTQVSLGAMAVNYHRLMRECETRIQEVGNYEDYRSLYVDQYERRWKTSYKNAFRKRNTYLWYSLLFYFYGIFDAVVDAHLHDMPQRMKLEPDLSLLQARAGLRVSWEW